MWLACASSSPRALKITDVLKTDRVDVTKVFLLHFEKFWKKELYEYVLHASLSMCLFISGGYLFLTLRLSNCCRNYVGSRGSTSVDDASTGLSSSAKFATMVPPSPTNARPSMTRRLSLCVQTTTCTTSTNGSSTSPDAKKPLQRRFSMMTPPPSPIKEKQPKPPTSPPASPKKKPSNASE